MKVLVALAVLLIAVAVGASAAGGLRLGLEFGNPNAVLIVRPAPLDFRIGYSFVNNQFIFLSADYRILDAKQLIDFVHFFFSAGAYTSLAFDPAAFDLGLRIPLGFQAFLFENALELFLELAPTVQLYPELLFDWQNIQGWIGFTIRLPKP